MKRLIALVLGVGTLAVLVMAGTPYTDVTGDKTDTLINAGRDSGEVVAIGMVDGHLVKYQRILGEVYVGDYSDIDLGDTAMNNTDSGWVYYIFELDRRKDTVEIDTLTSLPGISEFNYFDDIPDEGDTSTSGTWLDGAGQKTGLMMDLFRVTFLVTDSAAVAAKAAGDSVTTSLTYKFRCVED